jgi:hypothetical protein
MFKFVSATYETYCCFFSPLFGIVSCRCHEETCQPGGLLIAVVGFDSSELRDVEMRRYDEQGYKRAYDTIRNTTIIYDTVNGKPHTLLSLGPSGGYNWEVFFPAVSKTVRLYNLRYEHQTQKVCDGLGKKYICTSPITAYTQDGVVHVFGHGQSSYTDYVVVQR